MLAERYLKKRYAEGKAEGKAEGRTEGRVEGRAEGIVEGRAEGRTEGRAEGRAEGEIVAHSLYPPEIRDWNRRRLEAEMKGEDFDEPPPPLNGRV